MAYAGLALKNGDFDLGAKLLDPQKATHAALLKQLQEEKQERDARVQRLKTARRVGVALVVTVLVVVTVAFFLVNNQRNIAEAAKNDALEQKKEAVAQKKVAEHEKEIATENEEKANKAKADALAQKQVAVQQRGIAEAQTEIAKQNEEKANRATQKEEYGAVYRTHRPGGGQDRRQCLRSRFDAFGRMPAGVAELGMGKAPLSLHAGQSNDRRHRSR